MQIDTDSITDPSSSTTSKEPPASALRSSNKRSSNNKSTSKKSNDPPAPIHPTLDSYKYKIVVEISANIPKTDKVYPILREKILAGLTFIHNMADPSAAFLPKPGSDRIIPIYDDASFPLDQFTTGMNFFVYPNDYSLFPIKNDNRWIRLSVNMGFNKDPKTFLHVMKIDLMALGATFEVKLEQSLNTCSNIVFLGAPQFINKSYAKEVMDMYLIPLEREMMELDPTTYPESIHNLPWPSYSMVIEQPGGLFEAVPRGMKRTPPPRERRTLQMVCAEEDYDRLAALVKAAKRKGIWTAEFGNGQCFPVEVPEADSAKLAKDNYKIMVETHSSSQLGAGHATFSGIKDDRVEMMIERGPDLKGSRPPVQITLRNVLRRMQFKGYPLWVCLIRTDKKQGFDIVYDGQCPITTSYVSEFLKCPAAQVMFWLLKRGFDKEQVEAFLMATFNLEQLTLCTQARYNASIKLAQVSTSEDDMDIFTASQRKGSKINPDLGLTPERSSIRQAQLKATVCNLGKFDFSKPQDLRTVGGNASIGQWSVDASLGKSIYQVGGEADEGEEEDGDDGEDEEDEEDEESDDEVQIVEGNTDDEEGRTRQVQFSMDLPGGRTTDTLVLPDSRSVAPLLLPSLQGTSEDMVDMQGVETEGADTPSGIFADALWNLAPENYKVLYVVLDQLDLEIRTCRNMPLPVIHISDAVKALITDSLWEKLVNGAGELDFLDFVDNIRAMLDELRSADVDARKELGELFRKRGQEVGVVEEGEDDAVDETFELEEEIDFRNNDGLSAVGLPSSTAASSLQTAAASGTVDPQGSLLSAQATDAGDVETTPAGRGSG